MADDQPRVELTSHPSHRDQFGKGRLSYENPIKHGSWSVILGSATALVVSVATLIFSGSPKKDGSDQASQFLGVQIPQNQPPVDAVDIPAVGAPKTMGASPAKGSNRHAEIRYSGPQVIGRPRNIPIPPGSMATAVLVTGASDGPVKAALKEPLVADGETLLEAGTVLMGTGQSGEDRLMIHFRKAVFRDGTTAKIDAQAADQSDKIPGVKGSRVGYRALKLAAGVGLNFAAGMSQALEDTQGQMGAVVTVPSMKNALLNGAARATLDEGQEMMNEYRSEKPVITVPVSTEVVVLFEDNS